MSDDTITVSVPKEIEETPDHTNWIENIDNSLLIKVDAARSKIESSGVITSAKSLGNGLYEKKWKSGLRMYFAVVEKPGKKTLLILGSGKGKDQNSAITRAREILVSYKVVTSNIAI